MSKTLPVALLTLIALGCSTAGVRYDIESSSKLERYSERSEEPKPEHPDAAARYWAGLHEVPKGETPARLNVLAKQSVEARRAGEGGAPSLPLLRFEEYGPGNFGGRLRGLVVHPTDSDTILVGSVSGGIWKTVDGGLTWEPMDDFLESLSVGSMLVDPADSDTVWVGTGEGFFNVDAQQGVGIFKSTDFGDTWTQLVSTADNADFHYVNRLARVGASTLLAATRTGIFRSPDLGASWSEVSGVTVTGRGFTDLKVDPSGTHRAWAYLYGAGSGLLTTVEVNSGGLNGTDYLAPQAAFGPDLTGAGTTGDVVLVNDGTGTVTDGCESFSGVSGKIALIDRGSCTFVVKVENAEAAGAVAAIVANNVEGAPFAMAGTSSTTIPSVMVSLADGDLFKANLPFNATLKQGTQLASGILRTSNSGASWTMLTESGNGVPETDLSRMEIGVGTDGVVYLAVSNAASETRGLWRAASPGTSFVKTVSDQAFIERQGWYDLAVGVDPTDSDQVLLGAVDMFKTTDGGAFIDRRKTVWNPAAGEVPNWVHADHHVTTWDPNNADTVYIGSDGGIFKSTDEGETWASLNNDLRIVQYYGISPTPDGESVTGGTQDNGTHFYFGDRITWIDWAGGDGGFTAIDQQQPDFRYGSYPNGAFYGSSDGGRTQATIALPDTDGALFINPFAIDPSNGNRLIVGTDNVFFSSNVRSLDSATWTDASGPLGASVSATTISPLNGSVAYAGTTAGTIFETTGLGSGGSFVDMTDVSMPTADVTWVEVDPHDGSGNTLYATFADYGTDRIWKSINGGASWFSIHDDLPEVPVFCVRVDPTDASRLFIGTEIGLFTTGSNAGGSYTWSQYDYGTAWTRVMQLHFVGEDVLWVGTHGRSIYRADRNPFEIRLEPVEELDGVCDVDGILDAGETADLPVTLTNYGGFTATGVTAEVVSLNPDVTVTLASLDFGDIAEDASGTQKARIVASSGMACLTTASIRVDVSHGGGSASETFEIDLAVDEDLQTGTLAEGAEGTTAFTHETLMGDDDWTTTNTQVHSGSNSWFTTDEGVYCDKSLKSPWLDVQAGNTTLDFWLYYDTEGDATQRWDGLVLEMRTAGGGWFDIGNLSTVPYDGQLFTNNSAPGRMAWSGLQTTWRNAVVDLGTTYDGQAVQVRFRMVCDALAQEVGFWIDDISVTNVQWIDGLLCDSDVCSAMFADGFETGDTSFWSNSVP